MEGKRAGRRAARQAAAAAGPVAARAPGGQCSRRNRCRTHSQHSRSLCASGCKLGAYARRLGAWYYMALGAWGCASSVPRLVRAQRRAWSTVVAHAILGPARFDAVVVADKGRRRRVGRRRGRRRRQRWGARRVGRRRRRRRRGRRLARHTDRMAVEALRDDAVRFGQVVVGRLVGSDVLRARARPACRGARQDGELLAFVGGDTVAPGLGSGLAGQAGVHVGGDGRGGWRHR